MKLLFLRERAHQLLSLDGYSSAHQHLCSFGWNEPVPQDQYILRMMIKSPWSNGYQIPPELEWIKSALAECEEFQENLRIDHPFVYITVRSGIVRSVSDDEWHVDGFSMRVPHAPEQNYIWSNCHPTEVLTKNFVIPFDFNPMLHNLHRFFQVRAQTEDIKALKANRVYQIDPYVVHRRVCVPEGTHRTFFRISFVPIEIEDDTCTPNPLLEPKVYNRPDIRNSLIHYR
jgi:hypothetical protein